MTQGAARRRPLLLFPCNGNAIEALDALGEDYECLGFVDDTPGKQAQGCMGWPVWDRLALHRFADAAVLAVPGGPSSFQGRRAVIDSLGVEPERWATVIHPRATVSQRARVGRNVLLMAGVVVTSNAIIGDHVCVLPNTVVHHDSIIGPYGLLGSNVSIAGHVAIEDNCYVGTGSAVMHGLRLGAGCLVGLGSTVIRDVPSEAAVAGNPARLLPLRQRTSQT
jgi:sugar O-acyltransferase (sialic acid O-acetyltransferase NeuD family)